MQQKNRDVELLKHQPLAGLSLEIAPFHRPALKKVPGSVFYADYATTSELIAKVPDGIDPRTVCEVDFVWVPGKQLRDCVTPGLQFDFCVASHVMEHVPNVLGWLQQILDVLKVGSIIQLALPDHRGCFDVFREPTQFHEMLQNWVMEASTPTPGQIYDFLSKNVAMPADNNDQRPFGDNPKIENFTRHYQDRDALQFALKHYRDGTYMDTHCSVFTPETAIEVLNTASKLGILNITVDEPVIGWREFFVTIRKSGEPELRREDFRRVGVVAARRWLF